MIFWGPFQSLVFRDSVKRKMELGSFLPKVSALCWHNRNSSIFWNLRYFHRNAKNPAFVSSSHLASGKIVLPSASSADNYISLTALSVRVSCHLSHSYCFTLLFEQPFVYLSFLSAPPTSFCFTYFLTFTRVFSVTSALPLLLRKPHRLTKLLLILSCRRESGTCWLLADFLKWL